MADPIPSIEVDPVAPPTSGAGRRLLRVRKLAWVLDRSIPIGGGYRIGLDPIIGLIPGLGDWLGAALSLWLVYEAVRLGVRAPVIARMVINILIETAVGAFPVIGDLFDAAWQANQRNLRLLERHYDPRRRPRSLRGMSVLFAVFALLFLAVLGGLVIISARLTWAFLTAS